MKITKVKFNIKGKNKKSKRPMMVLLFICLSAFFVSYVSASNSGGIILQYALGANPSDPISVLSSQVSAIASPTSEPKTVNVTALPAEEAKMGSEGETMPVLSLDLHPSGSSDGYNSSDGVLVNNHTQLTPNIGELLSKKLDIDMKSKGPKVLIVHTHASEAYKRTESDFYNPSDPSRTQDMNFTVMRVGEEMAKVLNDEGIETIQDRQVHDYPSYNGSYKSSLESVKSYLKKYPSIQVVLDIHRDAMHRADGTRLRAETEINGEGVAQVMIVTGTNQTGLDHPNWPKVLAFASQLQRQMNKDYDKFTRPIDLREERFNTHTTNASIILEVGTTANTLPESIRGGTYAARSLAKLLKSSNSE